jgi:hypothetical protein
MFSYIATTMYMAVCYRYEDHQVFYGETDFRTNSLDRLNTTCRPSTELVQDHLRINLQSYDNKRYLPYSFNNNSLIIYYKNIRGLQGKTNGHISSLYPELPHLLCIIEHHVVNPELLLFY